VICGALVVWLPRADNANYLWIQIFYSTLNAKGRAGFVMANSAGDARGSELEIRRQLLQAGGVDVMVSIGPNFFYTVIPSRCRARSGSPAVPSRHFSHIDKYHFLVYFAMQSEAGMGMNDLNKALGDISSIRRQMARSTEFRGYGPATLASTGLFALLAAGLQARWLPDPAKHISAYLGIWIWTAVLSGDLIGTQMYTRTRRIHSGLADEMIRMAVEQFLPSVGTGALITVVLIRFVPVAVWMLPGIWQVIFSLGVFSSCRFLPRPMVAAGAWYLLTGLVCVAFGDSRALSPWAMGIPYGAGQLLVAGILFFTAQEGADES